MGGLYALISVGLTLIFGVTQVVNFAHGEMLMIAMYLTYWLHSRLGLDPYVSILLVAPALFVLGALIHKTVIEPIITAAHHLQIFTTMGLSILLANLALVLWKADFRSVATSYASSTLTLANLNISKPKLFSFAIALAMTLGLSSFLKWTAVGRSIRATSQDRRAAMLMGINVNRTYLWAFALGSATVGVAGALLSPFMYIFPSVGGLFVTVAYVVVVLGGLGSMMGAFVGGLMIGVLESFGGFFVAPALKELIYFVVFIAILLIKPSGLFGISRAQ